jgi:hypothetical protein
VVYLSTNNGTSWAASGTGLPSATVKSMHFVGSNLFAVADGVYLSTNNGTSWTSINTGLTSLGTLSLTASNSTVFTGTSGSGVWSRSLSEICKPARPTISITNPNSTSPILTSSSTTGNQWFLNDIAIPSGTNQSYTVNQSGTYKVQVTINGCESDFSLNQVFIITGDISAASAFVELFPNPVNDYLTISLGEEQGKKEIAIYLLTGQELMTQQVSGNRAHFYFGEYPRGIYVAKILVGARTEVIKFVKQ